MFSVPQICQRDALHKGAAWLTHSPVDDDSIASAIFRLLFDPLLSVAWIPFLFYFLHNNSRAEHNVRRTFLVRFYWRTVFRMEKRPSSPEVKLAVAEEGGGMGSLLHHHDHKRLHRQSTISCDANFATGSSPTPLTDIPPRIPEALLQPETSSKAQPSHKAGGGGPDSPSRRKTSSKSPQAGASVPADADALDVDESSSFMANLRSQLKPINDWTVKHFDLMKMTTGNSTTATNPDGLLLPSARNSVSVPSSPHQHQAFTFEEYPGRFLFL